MVAILLNVIEPPIEYGTATILTLTTNVSAMIFYTLDGGDPTPSSNVYISPIEIPTDQPLTTFKAYATNGIDSSPIYSKVYYPPVKLDLTHARVSHAVADVLTPKPTACGSRGDTPRVIYSQPPEGTQDGYNAVVVDQDGYGSDPKIYPVREYDEPIPTYNWEYSESNWKGETSIGNDIGTLPAKAKIIFTPPAPEQGELNKATFDPRSLVTLHYSDKPNENSDTIFRPYFWGEDMQTEMYGAKLSTRAFGDGASCPSGSFMKYYYNPTKNTITFYYYDNKYMRWIISEEQIKSMPSNPNQQNALYNFIGPSCGDRNHIYRGLPFGHGGTFII